MTTEDPVDRSRYHMAVNARHSMPAGGYDGRNGTFSSPSAPSAAPLPHIDDVLAFPDDIDRKQSMRQLLDLAEATLAKSEMGRDYGKPALALKDYVRASVIVVHIIPAHYDYKDLKSGRSDWQHRHNNLLKRISLQGDLYDKIKRDITADNERSGIQPTVRRQESHSDWVDSFSASARRSVDNDYDHPPTNGAHEKSRPTVHPKPHSLSGNALKPGHGRAASTTSTQPTLDLAARFANLRGPQSLPGQDPRIKTHQIVPPKPLGPREMPPSNRPKITLDSAIPALPKMPDAIYSPARGNVSAETSRLPPSTPRGLFTRTGSSMSISSMSSLSQQPPNSDYFSAQPQSYTGNGSSAVPDNSLKIPEGDTITPEELIEAMRSKGSILIIDIRPREEFDDGHIMSSATISIEPSILTRENISAEEISESLILSPNQEQLLFERRTSYDLVVLYDQDSFEIPSSPRNAEEVALTSIIRALVHLSYGQELRNPPKVLDGGLDAWVDFMGPASLRSTTDYKSRRSEFISQSHPGFQRRPSKYIGKPLKPDVVKAWQEAVEIEEREAETATEQAFHRSTESFLRRFPSLSQQESMMSPMVTEQKPPSYGSSHKGDLYTDLPSPPTRPAPAVPRPSYTGISQVISDEGQYYEESSAAPPNAQPKYYTGLNNPHNWCYANSTLQSLLASPDFGRELSNSEWITRYKAPRKDDEKIEQPQLMIKIMSNLFHWMTTGKFQVMKAQTLMDYSRHLCNHSRVLDQFGGPNQQDAQEFMSFIMEHLHDETNCRRNRQGNAIQPDTKRQSLIQAASKYWRSHLELNQSIVDRYWRGLELSTVECLQCRTRTHNFTPFNFIPVMVSQDRGTTLEQALKHYVASNTIDGFACDSCRHKTKAVQYLSLARMPSLLCISFRRFQFDPQIDDTRKSMMPITWDFNDVDFTPFFVPASSSDRNSPVSNDRAFTGPFRYECYAVIVHAGSRTDNGHYFAYVRDSASHDPYAWFCCNDSKVTKVRIGSGDRDDVQDEVFKSGRDRVPYLVFFRRKS
ncbi:Deubiquitinating enzyme 8-like protein [Cladobotryum mycophilum]|uniref:Deubiquitinating enzyme 8-like protein n=1 Tax=Cladobotryum mycophilum TaxID=491253 RepID=A0ABR0SS31_9HYPO